MISLHSLILHEDKGSVLHINILNSEDHDYVDTPTWIKKLKPAKNVEKIYNLVSTFTVYNLFNSFFSIMPYLVLNNISFFISFISEL